jgi:hypothetical protein
MDTAPDKVQGGKMSDREAFEKFYLSIVDVDARFDKNENGQYKGAYVQYAWFVWQAAQSVERAQIVKPGEVGWQLREVYFDDVDGDLEIIAYRAPQPAVNQQLPAVKVWNQAEGRDGKLYAHGWNDCLAAIAAAQEPA